MKIRSITAFTNLALTEPELALARAANFLHNAMSTFDAGGIEVQSKRVASQPFPRILAPTGPGLAVAYAQRVQELAQSYGIDYVALGPVHAGDDPDYVDAIQQILGATEIVFCSISIADPGRGIDLALIHQTAKVIREVSALSEDGFGNLYLAAIANCPPGAPFFPVAYHELGEPMRFALAIQAADLALEAFDKAKGPADAQERLTRLVTKRAAELAELAEAVAEEFDIHFAGIDFSLAPYPGEATSLGGAIERLGISLAGGGAAAGAALIMSALDAAQFQRAGFNGLMLPVLEDSLLAARAADGQLSVSDLLLYSTLCGTGLDTIPLPGDIAPAALAGMLLDVAALSLRLDKPLTARLMPLPSKAAGDKTGMEDFPYFAPGRVMVPPPGLIAGGLLDGEGILRIASRAERREYRTQS